MVFQVKDKLCVHMPHIFHAEFPRSPLIPRFASPRGQEGQYDLWRSCCEERHNKKSLGSPHQTEVFIVKIIEANDV